MISEISEWLYCCLVQPTGSCEEHDVETQYQIPTITPQSIIALDTCRWVYEDYILVGIRYVIHHSAVEATIEWMKLAQSLFSCLVKINTGTFLLFVLSMPVLPCF
jgi:hypothetical protein